MEILYGDATIVGASAHSKWARRRKIDLAELIDEPWILTRPTAWNHAVVEKIFGAGGLSCPDPKIATSSIILRARLIAGSPYLGLFLTSVLRRLIADNYALTALPVDLQANASSIGIVTLKNRTLSPVVERFLACVRDVAESLAGKPRGCAARSRRPNVS
jgi:DNA-binding transcriptional LysR family regulator